MNEAMRVEEMVYDWNSVEKAVPRAKQITFLDETLRDGIQNPSVVDPPVQDKIQILHLMNDLGIQYANIGLPGAGKRAFEAVSDLAREIRDAKLRIKPTCAARTHESDIRPIVDVSQKIGIEIEVMAFVGSSPIRWYAEDWDFDLIQKRTAEATDLAVGYGLPLTYVTEDTTRSNPKVLERLFGTAVEHGASRLCLCDTVGHATPDGVRRLIEFTRNFLKATGRSVGIDWHGHNDRGLGLENALWAAEFGADRIHGCALGIGERVGNASMDQILLNMKLLGWIDNDLSKLLLYCKTVSRATRFPIPVNYPLAGDDAFRTATGVHAAAIIKAERKGDRWLADRIYSGVPAGLFGREQQIEIGPMAGESNVIYYLKKRNIDPDSQLVARILAAAKATDHLLAEEEVLQFVKEHYVRSDRTP